ncbi:[protein-PII] uridylyltransferase [Paralcaligenes ureilyticus]|uniref:Bifunctional uridylyltransferase/uridylyl-removing enzyme n=1 Tax=Paralcaligenes ureilyticus TaxID=627131 RepID=A0A4R3MDB1_9BURK|nr:[protein-PII] uridylyltransferase [Paralcaligenes ureilyticus]TCT10047.1 UTP--GlnB (protein PII) uridylyltransferase GlnD [Paralcaligenes ureilyticus]
MDASLASALRERLNERRNAAIGQFREQLHPQALLTALRRATDQALRELIKLCPLPRNATLAAVGGYGRGELYPHSDIDVLILLQSPPSESDTQLLETLVAALWDLGFDLGHSVRTVDDCRREAANDITVETSLMEARWLAGSKDLLQTLMHAMREQLDAQTFFQAKRAEMQQRHARHQDTPYALEPNCKEAPGGLRDLQVILWVAQAAGLGRTWREIERAQLLTPSEYRSLRRADLAFKRLRIELHLLTGRREDRVLFDLQPSLAAIYGFTAAKNRRPSEILMQRYYWAARVVNQLNTILMQAFEERLFPQPDAPVQIIDDDFCMVQNRLEIRHEDCFARNPTLLLRAFLVMQEHAELSGMSAQTMRAMWHARRRIDLQFRCNPVNRRLFLQILQQPRGIVHALRRMTMLNILPRYLPVFRKIVGQMQHDLFHAYTVDQHILRVIRNLRRFTMPEHAQEYSLASQLMANVERHWLLYIAALFHDIAKGRGGNHSELGAHDARRFCLDHGLDHADTELVEFLVREHLTMSNFAQKRDLSDPRVVHEFAQRVQNERRLTTLYLLTVADIRGTSPKVWNSWKGKLLEDLYRLTLLALGGAQPDTRTILAQRKESAAAEIRLMGLRDESREAFWQELDVAYFLRHEASEIAWHTRHLYYRVYTTEPVVKVRVIGAAEGLQVMVYTHDTQDLFITICGYFDRRALSVQEARIHTTRHGWALDSFIVLPPRHETDYRSQASLIEHELAGRLGQTDLRALTSDPVRRPGSRRSRIFPIVPNIELQPDESGASWRLSVTAADRSGLLYSLAQAFAEHSISLKMAKIMTLGDRVEDIFIIEGTVLGHPRLQLQFERSLLAKLDEFSA